MIFIIIFAEFVYFVYIFRLKMPREKGWKNIKVKSRNLNARRGKYDGRGKCDGHLTEALASLKTENSDTLCDVTKELTSFKIETKAIVQGSVYLVTEQSK